MIVVGGWDNTPITPPYHLRLGLYPWSTFIANYLNLYIMATNFLQKADALVASLNKFSGIELHQMNVRPMLESLYKRLSDFDTREAHYLLHQISYILTEEGIAEAELRIDNSEYIYPIDFYTNNEELPF